MMDIGEKLVELSDIQVLQREIECVKRKSSTNCTDCLNCDLLMPDERILTAYKNAIDALQNEQVVTVQEWIPVTERLPEPKHEFDARNWYLVALSNGVVKELAYEFHNHSVFGYGWRETTYPVTHWMELPQPPKGE